MTADNPTAAAQSRPNVAGEQPDKNEQCEMDRPALSSMREAPENIMPMKRNAAASSRPGAMQSGP